MSARQSLAEKLARPEIRALACEETLSESCESREMCSDSADSAACSARRE